jgi:hypothetical protein
MDWVTARVRIRAQDQVGVIDTQHCMSQLEFQCAHEFSKVRSEKWETNLKQGPRVMGSCSLGSSPVTGICRMPQHGA